MIEEDSLIAEARGILRQVVGARFCGTRNYCATRHFYFGEPSLGGGLSELHYMLGIECPWRIQTKDQIIVGSEDYYVQGESNPDVSWEPGMTSGHLQDEKLAELFGELRDGEVISTSPGFIVSDVEVDSYGGIQLGLTGGYTLVVFPCSKNEMEWIFKLPSGGALILMNAIPTKSSGYPGKREKP